jgi:hypothetical protein
MSTRNARALKWPRWHPPPRAEGSAARSGVNLICGAER